MPVCRSTWRRPDRWGEAFLSGPQKTLTNVERGGHASRILKRLLSPQKRNAAMLAAFFFWQAEVGDGAGVIGDPSKM